MFPSVPDLVAKIRAFINASNQRKHPFIWTKTPDQILSPSSGPNPQNKSWNPSNDFYNELPTQDTSCGFRQDTHVCSCGWRAQLWPRMSHARDHGANDPEDASWAT